MSGSQPTVSEAFDDLVEALPNDDNIMVTLAEFNQIRNGMTYQQVVTIIGHEGTVQSENRLAAGTQFDTHTIMYAWQNSDWSGMNAMFQNGALMQKSQFNLK